MTVNYDSVAYCATVHNGKVKYYEEYSLNGRVVYTVNITYKAYVEATGRIEQ